VMEPLLGGNLVTAPKAVQDVWTRSSHKTWTAVERALRWLWDQNEVGMVLSGMSSLAQVTENLRVVSESSIGELSDTERSLYGEARAAYQGQKAIGCTACDYCKPCPQGVDIPGNFRLFNQASMYGNLDGARGGYGWMSKSFEIGLSETDPRGLHCISCGECEPKCPQKLAIGSLMPEVAAVLGGEKTLEEAAI
jgi:predicted aldo/keto reductase-like oxidoreductase